MSKTELAIKDICWLCEPDYDAFLLDDIDFMLINKNKEIAYDELDYLVSTLPPAKDTRDGQ